LTLSKYLLIMELCFDAMLYSNLGNENSQVAISDVHAGRRFPTPALDASFFLSYKALKLPWRAWMFVH